MQLQKGVFIRNILADDLFEAFLVSAISSIFLIRVFLFVTHYPQLGGEGLHIAHMLWGGFFMLIALILLLSFLSKITVRIAAILGGIGFGAFIDELGKFITSDNNYFFQPTIALIYIIFIVLYLVFQAIPKYRAYSEKEYLINALEMLKEAVINDLDSEEERLAREYLKRSDQNDPIVKSLFTLLDEIDAAPLPDPGLLSSLRLYLRSVYSKLVKSQIITKLVVTALTVQSFVVISSIIVVFIQRPVLTFDRWGILITSVLSACFIIVGVALIRRSRVRAYQSFKLAVLIAIFLTQFFVFYTAQFYALIALFFNITVLLIIDYVLSVEREKIRGESLVTFA